MKAQDVFYPLVLDGTMYSSHIKDMVHSKTYRVPKIDQA